jgi:hypothetical protein
MGIVKTDEEEEEKKNQQQTQRKLIPSITNVFAD